MKIGLPNSSSSANGSSGAIYGVYKKIRTVALLLLATFFLAACTEPEMENGKPTITVYKSPDCGCCENWVGYLKKQNFNVVTRNVSNTEQIKNSMDVPTKMRSCHTATIGDYALEGHVPLEAINRMLSEKPKFKGLAAPGMPAASPGMGSSSHETYTIYSFDDQGNYTFYQRG